MSQHLGRTQLSAQKRLGELAELGHTVHLVSDKHHAVATITRADGEVHHILVTPGILNEATRRSNAFLYHAQSVLLTNVIHAICDWSDERDSTARIRRCQECGEQEGVAANFNIHSKAYDWYCPGCFHGEAA